MKTVVNKAEPITMQARFVPRGQVYTWGVGAHYYMSTPSGAVCLSDGNVLGISVALNQAHFDRQVRVVECELHVRE